MTIHKSESEMLLEELARTKQVLKYAMKVIEFYAAPESWRPGIAFSQNNLLLESDMYCVEGDHFFGGKKAKLFLDDKRNKFSNPENV